MYDIYKYVFNKVFSHLLTVWYDYNMSKSDEEKVESPSNKEVLKALDMLRRAVHRRSTIFYVQYEYEQYTSDLKSMSF